MKIQPIFQCHSCGWQPTAGAVVRCSSFDVGPWYCPTCTAPLPHVILTEYPEPVDPTVYGPLEFKEEKHGTTEEEGPEPGKGKGNPA